MNTTTIDKAIKKIEPGVMTNDIIINPQTNEREFIFIIKEEMRYLKRLSQNPPIEVVSGGFDIDNVFVIVFLAKCHDNPDVLYETYINIHDSNRNKENGKNALDIIINQDKFKFYFFDEKNNPYRAIAINNKMKENMKKFKEVSLEYAPWSMGDFDKAKQVVYRRYPDAFEMWDYLWRNA